jgi:hypothetical protein
MTQHISGKDRPSAVELLEIARAMLDAELLPVLPPERRVNGLMVASALAMAVRELAAAPQMPPDVDVAAIRAGRHDGDRKLYEILLADARARALISNPRYLDGDDRL